MLTSYTTHKLETNLYISVSGTSGLNCPLLDQYEALLATRSLASKVLLMLSSGSLSVLEAIIASEMQCLIRNDADACAR